MRAFLNNAGEIKFRHDPSAKRFVAEFIGGGAEARGGSIGSIKLFCELFALVDNDSILVTLWSSNVISCPDIARLLTLDILEHLCIKLLA